MVNEVELRNFVVKSCTELLNDPKVVTPLINDIKEMFVNWVNEGIHYEVESHEEYGRWYYFLKEKKLSFEEMISLYQTLGDWKEEEHSGEKGVNFIPTTFAEKIYDLLYDFIYDKMLEISELTEESDVDELYEILCDEKWRFIDNFQEKYIDYLTPREVIQSKLIKEESR